METLSIRPDTNGLIVWIRHVARTDATLARRIWRDAFPGVPVPADLLPSGFSA